MEAVHYFKALADETRLRLVNLSLHYELNVNEIVDVMNMGQSRISRHLKILTDHTLLTCRRDGMWTFYSAAKEGDGHRFTTAVKYLFDKEEVFKKDLAGAEKVQEERADAMVHFFDSIAGAWEKLKGEIIGDVDINHLIRQNISPTDTVVDLGCGTGDLLDALKDKAGLLIGVEKSPKMLEEARRRFAGDSGNIDLRIGELEHLPLREEEAGLAIVNMVLHHLPDPAKAFAEIHRVLQKDGGVIIVDLLPHNIERMRERYGDRWLGFSKEDIEKWLEDSGFSLKKIDYFDLKKGLKGFIALSIKK